MKLVIVESPTKCDTIKRYLGENYNVMASLGHVRDLSTSGKGGLGVDIENDFTPTYKINKDKLHVVRDLQIAASKADEVILATDPDREGEAIAWHLAQVLDLDINKTKRLEFHEITRESINKAIANPRTINLNLVSSQETRRIVDRIIGFKLSTLLNKKIHSKSAGRVQSAALKLIAEHDREVRAFVPEEYWNILVSTQLGNKKYSLTLINENGGAITAKNEAEANDIINSIGDNFKIISMTKETRTKESKEPFTTSTLQQEAFSRLKFKTKKTQFLAQELYEGIDVGGEHMGLITYMRTDSTRLSPTFIQRATSFILETYGKDYLGHVKSGHIANLAQDAHEAIRPASNHRTPESVKAYLSNDQYRLYELIYRRALASLMKPKIEEALTITLESGGHLFKLELVRTVFPGYEIILPSEEKKEFKGQFPNIQKGDVLPLVSKSSEQKFTQPPAHYSEAKIVKLMEEVGIGRPSTYASTIDTLKARKYVNDVGGILTITEQGEITADGLNEFFPDTINVQYTAEMESQLDSVEEGSKSRTEMLNHYYGDFMREYNDAINSWDSVRPVPTGETCPICGSPLVYKEGKNGRFVGCSNFPQCSYVKKENKPQPVYTGETCPICGSKMVERTDRKGNKFSACSAYPKCQYIKQEAKTIIQNSDEKICPECGSVMVKKRGKYGYFYGCTNYPACNHMEKISKKKRK